MTLKANEVPSNGPRQEPIEPGSYPARLVQVIDLGLQPQEYMGEEKAPKIEITTTYELSDEFMKDEEGNDIGDKPRWVSETFPLNSLNTERAKSTARYYALDPKAEHGGDWSKLLSTPVTITLINKAGAGKNKGKVFNNISGVSTMRPRDAEKLPALVNDAKYLDLDNPDVELFLTLPQWVQDKIKKGLEFGGSKLDELLQNHKGKGNEKPKEQKAKTTKAPVEDEDGEEGEGNW